MALKIRWTDRALSNLDEIIDYLKTHWTEKETAKFFGKLENALEDISQAPERNKISQRRPDTREYQISPQVTLFYVFDDENLTVMLIWPNKKNPDRLIP